MAFSFVLLSVSFASLVLGATNDWSAPCHDGRCAWDLPESANSPSGALQVWGAPQALADITPAAGWSIIDCDADATTQTVRIACADSSVDCNHLLQSNATDRIVRLTDECGSAPFARIASMVIADNQTVPSPLTRQGSAPTVYALTIDTKFSTVNNTHGPVNFAITVSSSPRVSISQSQITPIRRHRYQARSFIDKEELEMKRNFVMAGVRELSTRDLSNDFDLDNSTTLPPISVNKTGNIFNTTISCKSGSVPFDASVSADVDVVADAHITLGIVASGTIVPPNLDTAAITAGLSANINGLLRINASADGSFSSPSITLLDLPLPGGLEIPGVIELGPSFKVIAKANAKLGVGIDTAIGLTYSVDNATLVFPPSQGKSGGNFKPRDTPLQITTDTNVTGDASLTGHLIPEVVVGINAFDGIAQATLTLSLDASATIALNGSANLPPTGSDSSVQVADGACVDVSTAFVVSAGADAGLFNIFDKSTSVTLFSKSFDLFNTCTPDDISGSIDTSTGSNSTSSSDNSSDSSANSSSSDSSYDSPDDSYNAPPESSDTPSTSYSSGSTQDYPSSYSPSMSDCISTCSSMYGLTPPSSSYSGSSDSSSSSTSTESPSASMDDSSTSSSEVSSDDAYMSIKIRAVPTPRDASNMPVRHVIPLFAKRDDITCPSLPFNIRLPPAPAQVTPKAA